MTKRTTFPLPHTHLKVAEAARLLGVNHSTVYRWATNGTVSSVTVGKLVLVSRDSLAEHVGIDVARMTGIVPQGKTLMEVFANDGDEDVLEVDYADQD